MFKGRVAKIVVATALTSLVCVNVVSASPGEKRIFVNTVDELYSAVNTESNAGATVVLAPGRYCLSVRAGGDPCLSAKPTATACVWESGATGPTRPNGGRLDLQKDMALTGMAGDPSAVIIDGSLLPASSFTTEFGRTGVIRTGLGSNTVEWLTIAGSRPAAAAIETELVETANGVAQPTTIRVAHVVMGGSVVAIGSDHPLGIACASTRGVDVRNIGATMAGRRIDAEIVDSEVVGSTEGIRVANFNRADYGDIAVTMRGNHFHANRLGCIAENNRTFYAAISVRSNSDLFDDNGLGCQIGGGLVGQTGSANFNSTTFDGRASAFVNNIRTDFSEVNPTGPLFEDLGGLLVVGGELLLNSNAAAVSANTVLVQLRGSRVADNQVFDLAAYGARSVNPTATAVTDNHVVIELYGLSKFVDVLAEDSDPPNLPGTNTVAIVTH